MSGYDLAGNYTRGYNFQNDRNNAILIRADRVDSEFDLTTSGFNLAFLRDGRVAMTGDLKMGNFHMTGLSAGAAGSPSIAFNADPTTGIYSSSAGVLDITLAGASTVRFTNGGGGATNLMELRVGGVAKFSVTISGVISGFLVKTASSFSSPTLDNSTCTGQNIAPGLSSFATNAQYALVIVTEKSTTGHSAIYLVANGIVTAVMLMGNWVAPTTTPAAGKFSVAYFGGFTLVYNGPGAGTYVFYTTIIAL